MNNTTIINKLEKFLETGEIARIEILIKELRIDAATKEVKGSSFKNEVKKFLKSAPSCRPAFQTPYKTETSNNFILCNGFALIEFEETNKYNPILERIL